MLQKDPIKRISAIDALNHQWFELTHADEGSAFDNKRIIQRLKEFRAP
jgi:hypothetical protein